MGCCALKFLHELEIDQGYLVHTPSGTGVPLKNCSQKVIHLLPGEHGGIFGRLEVGYRKKWHDGEQKRQYLWNA